MSIIRYVAPVKKLSFCIPVLDSEGKRIEKRNPNTREIMITKGLIEHHERVVEFSLVEGSPTKGFLCQYEVTDETDSIIAEYLEKE